MDKKKVLKEEYSGSIEIGDMIIEAAVLEGGMRVLSYRGISRALGNPYTRGAAKLPPILSKNSLKPFISEALSAQLSEPIEYQPKRGGRTAYGIPATLLPQICDVWLKAREGVHLGNIDTRTAARAEVLMRALAHIGIIALVDEATGYQEARDRAELQTILSAYIAKELLPWTMRFPHDFYKEMFRLRGWEYSSETTKKRPKFAGYLTKKLIYDQLPEGVIDEIKKLNPRRTQGASKGLYEHHHHQFLTQEVGHPHLDKLIASVTTLMRISPNWRKFEEHFARAFGQQQALEFPEAEESSKKEE